MAIEKKQEVRYSGVNLPWSVSPRVLALLSQHSFLGFSPTLSCQSPNSNPFPPLVGTFSPALGKGPRTLIFPHTSPLHLSDPASWT